MFIQLLAAPFMCACLANAGSERPLDRNAGGVFCYCKASPWAWPGHWASHTISPCWSALLPPWAESNGSVCL